MSGSVRIAARTYPFGLPDGWFALEYSDRLARGATRRVHYFGCDLDLARDEAGRASVTRAPPYSPFTLR